MVFAPFGPDGKTLLTALRPLSLILVGWVTGASAAQKRDVIEWLPALLSDLCIHTIAGAASMMMLSEEFRNDRYWISAILQSQIANDVAISLLLIPIASGGAIRARTLALVTALICTLGGYKVNFFFLPALAGIYLAGNMMKGSKADAHKSYSLVIFAFGAMLAVGLIVPFVVTFYLADNGLEDDAIGTRYYQVLNVMETLYKSGPFALCFGIGWNQWYAVVEKFPFLDLGAWTQDQIENPFAKFSVQLVPFSLIRSTGFIGLASMFVMLVRCGSQAVWNVIEFRGDLVRIFCLMVFHSLQLLCVPSLLPEGAFLNALVVAALCCVSGRKPGGSEPMLPPEYIERARFRRRLRRPVLTNA